MSIDAEKAFLKKEGVYDHLERIVNRVITEQPKDAYDLVEVLSRLIKAGELSAQANLTEEEVRVLSEHVKKSKELDKVPTAEGGEEPITVPCAVPDFVEEADMFCWTGVGLDEMESYKVMCSMRNHAAKLEGGFNKLRFWGKILGTDADYYVAEAARDSGGEAEEGEDMDPPGSGANTHVYFVTTDLAGSWVQLPDIKPKEIVAARLIKRLFTGNPKAKVITHPSFAGKEEVLLRAQIARITSDTVLCVKGVLKREDEEDPSRGVVPNEEFVMPPPAELFSLKAWTHMAPHILNNGRTAHNPLPDPDEDAALFTAAQEEREADPEKEVLRGIEDDGGWVVKQTGDSALYQSRDAVAKLTSNAVTFVRSLAWPGAVCAVRKGNYANLYIGYAIKAGEPDFFLPAPPDVQDEPEDPGEAREPQGTEEEADAPAAGDDD